MPADSNPEEIELDIKVRVKVVEAKIKQFNASFVSVSTLPIIGDRLKEIRDLYDETNSTFFKFEAVYADSTSIGSLRKLVEGLGTNIATNETAVMVEVAKLYPDSGITEDKSSAVAHTESKTSRSIDCQCKRDEFYDQVSLLSISSGLDLANPETELEDDDLKAVCEKKTDSEISKLMRESKTWSKSLLDVSRVFRAYEKLAKESGEDEEELLSNKTVFESLSTRIVGLETAVSAEDVRRNLYTLDNNKSEKVKYPTFSGDKKEDYLKFKTKMMEAFTKNRVVLGDQLDKLRENLKGEALKYVPQTISTLEKAWSNLSDAYGDPLRILKERIKVLDAIKALPPMKKKDARVTWFLEFESVLEDIIELGGDEIGQRSYCTAFSEFTLEKIISAFPDDGEDVLLRVELSSVDGEGKTQFENIKKKITEFRQSSQRLIGCSGKSSKSGNPSLPAKPPTSHLAQSPFEFAECRICLLVSSNTGFESDVTLFEGHIGNFPTHCPVFMSFSVSKRRAAASKINICTQCLDPKIKFTKDHLNDCAATKKDQFYTCKSTGCKSHLWCCVKHKDAGSNKKALENESKRLKSKFGLDFSHITVYNAQTCREHGESFDKAVKTLQKAAADAGKELIPAPEGNALFLFFGAKGKTRCLNTFMDSGSSGVIMKSGVPGTELPGRIIRKGPFPLKGVGGITALAEDEWLTAIETKDRKLQAMQVITMKQVTSDFPRISITSAVNEIKQDKPSHKKLQNLRLPKEVGGWDTDILMGIEFQSLFPKEVHSLPSGLTIYESGLRSHDGKFNGMIGGPHSTFTALAENVGGHSRLLSMFVDGLAKWRSLGPMKLTQFEMSSKEELFACVSNFENENEDPELRTKVLEDFDTVSVGDVVTCQSCGVDFEIEAPAASHTSVYHSAPAASHTSVYYSAPSTHTSVYPSTTSIEDIGGRLSVLKKMVEMQEPYDVEYRCIECRDCSRCRDGDKTERISLREEAEMYQIKQSIFLNYDKKRIDCSLPLRGPERSFLSTNTEQAIAILNKQCQKYFGDPEVKESINKAFKKLLDRGFIRKISDLSEEEKAKFMNKEVQYTIPWRCVWKDSATTPVRPVLDASTNSPRRADGSGGSSLNNAVCHGKVDTLDLLKVLLRFILLDHAVAADITKMYNMFNLLPEYWNLQRVVLKEDLNPAAEVIEAVITTLIYGVTCVSCQTECACDQIADDCKETKPDASEFIDDGRYVDNILGSLRTDEEARRITGEVDEVFSELNLSTRGWTHSGEPPNQEESLDGVSLDLMGVRWFPQTDSLQVKIPRLHFGKRTRGRLDPKTEYFDGDFGTMDNFVPKNLTRRHIVSKRAGIFDVLGKIEPIKAKLKVFERKVLYSTIGWDDPMPEELRAEAVKNFILVEELRNIQYHRPRIPVDAVSTRARLTLVVDAAKEVIMIDIYIGFKKKDGTWSNEHLISRSALCNMTTPRNEMAAMVGGANLLFVVIKALLKFVEEHISCCDSEIVLNWIFSDHRRLDTWHRNRVVQVRRILDLDSLYHVSGKFNPADIGTRPEGITKADVGPGSRYEQGDHWMTLERETAVKEGYITPAAEIRLSPEKVAEFKEGLLLESEKPETLVKGHACNDFPNASPEDSTSVYPTSPEDFNSVYPTSPEDFTSVYPASRKDLIAERTLFGGYDSHLLPTRRAWPKQLRIATLAMTFIAKLYKRLGKTFKGKLMSHSNINFALAIQKEVCEEEKIIQKTLLLSYQNVSVTNFEEGCVKTLSLLECNMFVRNKYVSSCSDEHVQLALRYYFRIATLEVKEFNSKSLLDRIAIERDGILISRSRINDVLNFVETGDLKISDLGSLNLRSNIPVVDRYSPLSYAIAKDVHNSCHRGVETCFRISMEQVQIIRGFSLFKEIDSECVKCIKKRGKFTEVLMGPVPENQVTIAPAFYCCQVDLYGPVKVFCPGFERDTRNSNKKELKNWILVGACPTTKALNLQVVDKSDTRGVLEALIRLGCEVGWPKLFFCDADSVFMKIMAEIEVSLSDVQYNLYTEYGATFEVCPVGGHERQGLVERRIQTVQKSFNDLGLKTMRIHSMGLQSMCKIVENTLNNLPYGYTQSRSDSNQSLYKLISPNMLRHGRNNNRAVSGPVKISADNKQMMKDVTRRTEAWFKIFKDSCIPQLVIQRKWFKSERDLAVGDLVFFRKTESELGDGNWIVGLIDQVIPSDDGLIRKVVVRYRNSSEDFDRFTTRSVRKLIKLFNIDEENLSIDLQWVEEQLEKERDYVSSGSKKKCEAVVKCVHCCCREHCRVSFHNFSKTIRKVPVKPIMPELNYGFEDVITEWAVNDVDRDIEATACCIYPSQKENFQESLFDAMFRQDL